MRTRFFPNMAVASASVMLFASAGLAQDCTCESNPKTCEMHNEKDCTCKENPKTCEMHNENITAVQINDTKGEQATSLFNQGKFAEACDLYAQCVEEGEASGREWFNYGYSLHVTGQLEKAKEAHKEAAGFANFRPIALYNLGCAHALEGDVDMAFEALDKSAGYGFAAYDTVVEDSDLVSLHDDSRWEEYEYSIKKNAKVAETRRQLDFWVGNWSVQLEDGTEIGVNRISQAVAGNCIIEDWQSERYGMGKSISFYDANAEAWKQTFVGLTGESIEMKGRFEDGVMTFYGEDEENGKFKNSLKQIDDGRLLQTMQRSSDGEEWKSMWSVYYAPLKEGYGGDGYESKEKKAEKKQISAY